MICKGNINNRRRYPGYQPSRLDVMARRKIALCEPKQKKIAFVMTSRMVRMTVLQSIPLGHEIMHVISPVTKVKLIKLTTVGCS